VSNLLRLLNLPERIHRFLDQKLLELGHAKLLVGLKESEQLRIADLIVAQGLSVRESEKLLGHSKEPARPVPEILNQSTPSLKATIVDPDIQRLQQMLSEKLGAKIEFIHQPGGKGRLIIHYHSLEVLDGILAHIQ
jgi:ParB family chromosome partitioning protein